MLNKDVQYVLSCENALNDGYITEKSFTALLGGSVPVVYGGPHVSRILNAYNVNFIDITSEKNRRP